MNADGSAKGQPFLIIKEGQYTNLVNWTAHGLCYANWFNMVDVFIMPVDPQTGAPTGKPRQLEFRPTGRNSHPVWSPDGKHLAFVSNLYGIPKELYVVIYPISGGEARKFRVPNPREQRIVPRMIDLRWLPDGSGISYSANSPQTTAGSKEDVDFKMYVLKLNSGEWHSWDLKLEVNASFTDWRGDGKGIYYARYPFSTKNYKLAPGIVERDLTTGDERYIYRPEKIAGFASIRCSRDFSKLAFHQILNGPLIVIDIKSGEKLNEFKDVGFPSPPTWSPDGKMLMISNWRQNNKLNVISIVDGSRKAYDVDMDFFPNSGILVMDWAPDGTKIAFANTYSKSGIYLLRDVIPEEKK